MLADLTMPVTKEMFGSGTSGVLAGHIGTHFDQMDKEFPLDYCKTTAAVFDIRGLKEVRPGDLDLSRIQRGMAVIFYSGFMEEKGYDSEAYAHEHPELSQMLIKVLCEKRVALIGLDFKGARRGKEHSPCDQYCADRGVFIIENMDGVSALPKGRTFTLYTFPMRLEGCSGAPCRVLAEV